VRSDKSRDHGRVVLMHAKRERKKREKQTGREINAKK
jgi:hypothetical protein